jgi:hypothetical protein
VPIRVRAIVLGEAETWLDGSLLPGGHTRLEPGAHVLALHVTKLGTAVWGADDGTPLLPAPFVLDLLADHGPNRNDRDTDVLAAASSIERRWTSSPPPPGWSAPAFEDRTWDELRPAPPELLERCADHVRRAYERLREGGAAIFELGARTKRAEAWVRVRFTLDERKLHELSSPAEGR